MGLLDLLLKNQSNLDINPVPLQGNGPVAPATGEFNTGTTPFQQVWDSTNTYVKSFIGSTNTGIQPPTLKETGLDIDNPNYVPSTTTPNTLTVYPATALGGLGQSAVQFLQIWTPVINYNNIVVGASTSPLAQSLPETGLDNTDVSAVPTTVSPINPTNYPNLSTGEYNSVSNQYTQVYGPSNTYLNTYDPNVQPNSLDETGLDIENIGLVSTTIAPSTNTPYPSLASGEFGGKSDNFNQVYIPTNTYLNTFNPNTQPNTITQGQTGLDNINPLSSPTTTVPIDSTQYPNQSTGEFGGASTQYSDPYGPNKTYENTYVDNPVNFDTLQTVTLDETGLDNTNSQFVQTTSPPIDPTQYPSLAAGEFGSNSNQYTPQYGPNKTYETVYITNPFNFDTLQPVTLDETGLDNTNPVAASTTPIPNTPTTYPSLAAGEFGGASTQYASQYTPNSTYENTYVTSPVNFDTLQPTTLGQTGLDNTDPLFAPTTIVPIDNTTYPVAPQTNLGEFNNAIPAAPFSPQYNPGFGYLNTYNNIITLAGNVQVNTLSQTGLDVENSNAITFIPNAVSAPTSYPQFVQGEFNGGPTQYIQVWNPFNKYFNTYNPTLTNTIQSPTLGQTGLDNTNPNTAPTSLTPTDPTQYPQYVQGEFNGVPTIYNQIWGPGFKFIANFNPNIQPNTLGQTGLDNTNPSFVPTTAVPNVFTSYPQFTQGEFNGVPTQFSQIWDFNNKYIVNFNPNIQPSTLSQTGLDVEDPTFVPTTTTPSTITQYPVISTGEFGGVSTQYTQVWNPNNTYDANFNPNIQPNTLGQTGLDVEDPTFVPTTTTPSTVTQYPLFVQGEFNTAPNQYSQIWGPINQYIINYNPNIQPNTVNGGETGLDNTNLLAFNTTFVPNAISAPTIYPQPAQTFLGEFQGAPSQFNPLYNPNPGQGYLDSYNTIINNTSNPQIINLGNTGLDVENAAASPTTYTVPGYDVTTVYPPQVTGEYNGAPTPYGQTYTPNATYEENIINAPNGPTSILENSSQYTGLDIENKDAAPTTYAVPDIDDTEYPIIQGAFSTLSRIARPYSQSYNPINTYYSFMIDNYSGQVI